MKVVHLCLGNFYVDNHTYQENLLPKAHNQLGYEVEIIAGTMGFDDKSTFINSTKLGVYTNEYGIQVTRLPYRWNCKVGKMLRYYKGIVECLESSNPDIIFIHNCQFMDIDKIVLYIKQHPSVRVFVDNHADFNNSATNWISKFILHRYVWKNCARKIEPYVSKFYGVLPTRVQFLKDVYGLPDRKCELLVMGGDDDLISKVSSEENRIITRKQYGISKDDFFVVTGGKINWARPETLNLMEAVGSVNSKKVKLVVFGSVSNDLKGKFEQLCKFPNVRFAGWLNTEEVHRLMASSDLAVFPGLHSVLWEQACALGIPCIFRDLEGVHHVDLGGNAIFLKDVSVPSLLKEINELISFESRYKSMKEVSQIKGKKNFSYLDIAKRSLTI